MAIAPFEQRRFRDLNAFLRATGVAIGRVEFNVAFYGLIAGGIVAAALLF